jgi:high-affinity K+ transport system ATPase subunit B
MGTVISVIIWLALAAATVYVANSKGRNIFLWGILGLIVPLIALIVVFVLPSKAGVASTA